MADTRKKKRIVIMAIKPKYAEAIYSGGKRWEFRKAPPPVPDWVWLYESAPVSAITGRVFLAAKIQGHPESVWSMVKTQKTIGGGAGITEKEFRDYVGKKLSVAACATFFAERTAGPIPLPTGVRPPQNWGRYIIGDEESDNG